MVWQRALAMGPIEVQIYGDFDRKETVAALQRTFGALAPRPPLPASVTSVVARFPQPSASPTVLTHRGDANQAAAVIAWPTGGGSQGIRLSRELEILTQLFSNRLMDKMREKMGASYAPQVFSSWPLDMPGGGSITALAQVDPASAKTFYSVADAIAADLAARPPSADELERVVEPLRQQVTRAATSSAFFMYQIKGASQDPARYAGVRTLLTDYTQTTPARMQELAREYLAPGKAWRLSVLPQGSGKAVGAASR